MIAFKLAALNKIQIELDIHILKDDIVVVFHDDNLKCLTKDTSKIKDMFKDIKNINPYYYGMFVLKNNW